MGSRGLRSGGAKGGKSHPETSRFALAWLPSRAFSCLLPPCLPKLEAKASLTPRVIPSFGCLCTDSQPQNVGCIAVYLILSFHAGRVFSLHVPHCAQLCSPLAPGFTWSGPGHQSQVSCRVLRPQAVVRSLQGAGTDQPDDLGQVPGVRSETRGAVVRTKQGIQVKPPEQQLALSGHSTTRAHIHMCSPHTHILGLWAPPPLGELLRFPGCLSPCSHHPSLLSRQSRPASLPGLASPSPILFHPQMGLDILPSPPHCCPFLQGEPLPRQTLDALSELSSTPKYPHFPLLLTLLLNSKCPLLVSCGTFADHSPSLPQPLGS
ncbi:hypothetical protein mRhiFer1_009665 [Rhinolophus ferrumequinum]|uniref:Uncharacterized protein n=1 Tax=Rhinolophus ferrumequinum TaxID=59479 RepID=A0A7J7R606_RHIFE|nr:hypothetical protein mRhiFer1_009665 [Rhinolophus ferrumequinum]